MHYPEDYIKQDRENQKPKHVFILGHKIDIKFADLSEHDEYGEYSCSDDIIQIDNATSELTQRETLMHEIKHAIFDKGGFNEKDEADWDVVFGTFNALEFEVYRVNPDVARYIFASGKNFR